MADLSKYSDADLQAIIDKENAPAAEGPSFTEDVKAGAVPWAARGVEDLAGTPGALTDLAGRGLSAAANYLPESVSSKVGAAGDYLQNSRVAKKWGPEGWAGTVDPYVSKMGYDPNYQPQTSGGGFVRTGLEFAPATLASMALGPEAMAATLARGAGAAGLSEGAGQLSDALSNGDPTAGNIARTVGALVGGHYGPRAVTPFPASIAAGGQARVAAADQLAADLKPYGGRVDAATRTGSPTLRGMLGPAPDTNQAFTEAAFGKANVPYKAGQPIQPAIAAEEKAAGQAAGAARRNAWMVRDTPFWNKLQDIEKDAKAQYPAGSKQLDQVNDALTRARMKSQASGTPPSRRLGQLNGPDYVQMRDDFLSSKNPHVNQLGQALEEAAHRTPGAPWKDVAERYANALRLKAGAQAAGPTGMHLDPAALANATAAKGATIRTATPLGQMAENAANVLQPIPAKESWLSNMAGPAIGAAAAHFMPGAEAATKYIGGFMTGEKLSPAVQRMQRALLRTRPAQAYLGNQKLLPGRDYGGSRAARRQRAAALVGPLDQRYLESDQESQQ